MTQIDYDLWLETYKPIRNPINQEAAFDGFLFETYGQELKSIRETPIENVWTLVEEDGTLSIESGFLYVNRLGYFKTKTPCDGNLTVTGL